MKMSDSDLIAVAKKTVKNNLSYTEVAHEYGIGVERLKRAVDLVHGDKEETKDKYLGWISPDSQEGSFIPVEPRELKWLSKKLNTPIFDDDIDASVRLLKDKLNEIGKFADVVEVAHFADSDSQTVWKLVKNRLVKEMELPKKDSTEKIDTNSAPKTFSID